MITFSLSVKIKWSKGKSQTFFFPKNQVLEPMRDLKQPIFIKSDKITKKSLDFYFYFHIYCHRHHRQTDLRIWCSWCSIADFSSVCTGSSPVIRYLSLLVFWNAWSYHLRFGFGCYRRCDVLLFLSDCSDVLKEWLGREDTLRDKEFGCLYWCWCDGDLSIGDVWCF